MCFKCYFYFFQKQTSSHDDKMYYEKKPSQTKADKQWQVRIESLTFLYWKIYDNLAHKKYKICLGI